jgi:hypothetical protein
MINQTNFPNNLIYILEKKEIDNQLPTFKHFGETNFQFTETDEANGQQKMHFKVLALF